MMKKASTKENKCLWYECVSNLKLGTVYIVSTLVCVCFAKHSVRYAMTHFFHNGCFSLDGDFDRIMLTFWNVFSCSIWNEKQRKLVYFCIDDLPYVNNSRLKCLKYFRFFLHKMCSISNFLIVSLIFFSCRNKNEIFRSYVCAVGGTCNRKCYLILWCGERRMACI